jgi:pimeloyl-ACP methyl ester carboxylesterase
VERRTRSFEQIFTRDQLLTEIMLYVVTGTFDTSLWMYNVVQYRTYAYGGHFPFYENPVGLLDGIREFLRATDTVATSA